MVDERIIKALETRFWMTREELCDELNVSDRNLRDKIADINVAGGPYENVFVIGTSDMPGYRLARTVDDLKHYIRERTKRAEMIMLPVEKAERILKEMEKWTS
ncbi:HTH domain-containing protein [uncultured Dubosiella sp.]|uniref:HTH domain-containing protein n=1 Tax=uncultured Dubosiella sp. TaxID=1937011 RepID=UPI00258A550A|nr:HTH domain-containing protein [uncultured Dubosiella sp.]